MKELRLKTPEGVTFSFLLAGPTLRMLAWLIDFATVIVISQGLALGLQLAALVSRDLAMGLMIASYFIVSTTYGIIMEYSCRGQTLGKRLLRLRVIDMRGMHLTLAQVVVRNLFRTVDQLPLLYFLGGTVCAFSRYYQRLGDLAANTVVIRHPKLKEPDLSSLGAPLFNSLRAHPHLVGRLRQRIAPAEAALLFDALLRRESFTPTDRLALFRELAGYCRSLADFPPETIESITDEQVVRNVVDLIFEKTTSVPLASVPLDRLRASARGR